jgi:hypothetical protein
MNDSAKLVIMLTAKRSLRYASKGLKFNGSATTLNIDQLEPIVLFNH